MGVSQTGAFSQYFSKVFPEKDCGLQSLSLMCGIPVPGCKRDSLEKGKPSLG